MRASACAATALLVLLGTTAASAVPQGLVAVAPDVATGTKLNPPGIGFTDEAPTRGWAWYRPQAAAPATAIFVAATDQDLYRIVLTAGGASSAAQFDQVMKTVEADLRKGWATRSASLSSFAYKEPSDFAGVLRFSADASLPEGQRQFVVGYVHLGQPTIMVQAVMASPNEPLELREVARSIRRVPSPSAVARQGKWLQRVIYAAEAVLAFGLVAFLWHFSNRRRKARGLFERGDA